MEPAELLDGNAVATAVYEKVRSCLNDVGSLEVRTIDDEVVAWLREAAERAG